MAVRCGEADHAAATIVGVAEPVACEHVHQGLHPWRRVAVVGRIENIEERPQIAVGAVTLDQEKPVQGRPGFLIKPVPYPGDPTPIQADFRTWGIKV